MRYENPILKGFHPDPSVCRGDDGYYLAASSFEFWPAVPIYHSVDLVHWRRIGHAFTRVEQADLSHCAPSSGMYAPTLRRRGGRFYLTVTNMDGAGHLIVSAEDPAGDWSDPVTVPLGGIDPSLLFDGDKTYFCCNTLGEAGRQGIVLCEINPDTGEMLTQPVLISHGGGGRYPEAPHLYRIGDWYYLMLAEGGTKYGHMITIFRAKDPYGPYEACPRNPILTHRDAAGHPVQAVGHGDLLLDENGRWWMVCLGIRPLPGLLLHPLGRETFLAPVEWDAAGWPVVNGGGTLEFAADAPLPAWKPDGGAFLPEWRGVRGMPDAAWEGGALALGAGAPLASDDGVPGLLVTPQREFSAAFSAYTEMPRTEGARCGVTAFVSGDYQYALALVRRASGCVWQLRRRVHDLETIDEGPAEDAAHTLEIRASEASYRFFVRGPEGCIEAGCGAAAGLCAEGTRYMSFTGVMLGVFCEGETGRFSDIEMRDIPREETL